MFEQGHDIIAIGASTGGVEALTRLVGALPPDLPAAVFVVIHFPPDGTSVLPAILNRAGPLPAAHAEDGEPIRRGRIYVARPDFHLLVTRGRVRVVRGPRENRHRPAVDTLFRSAAVAYGPRAVGVVLTGALDDGAAGLRAIKGRGGVAVVQDPNDALIPSMPENALRACAVDHCLPLAEIGPALAGIARAPADERGAPPVPREMEFEARSAALDPAMLDAPNEARPGIPSSLVCPECKGPLWEIQDGPLLRFRCRTGHAFTADTMVAEQAVALEEALWTALNILEESALMSERLASDARGRSHTLVAQRFEQKSGEMRRRAGIVRDALLVGGTDQTIDEVAVARAVNSAEADMHSGQAEAEARTGTSGAGGG